VSKCLSKSPEDRFQTATDLRAALETASTAGNFIAAHGRKRLTSALVIAASLLVIGAIGLGMYLKRAKAGRIDSIAVLPLENRSSDPDADYISD
jgi:hypothetical protein